MLLAELPVACAALVSCAVNRPPLAANASRMIVVVPASMKPSLRPT
jgi:hypothetical protein